jgi:hypothetical protein
MFSGYRLGRRWAQPSIGVSGSRKQEGEGGGWNSRANRIRWPAVLWKGPSGDEKHISNATPHFVAEGTLDECIKLFTSKPMSLLHLYEIHTIPQGELITAVLSAMQIIELAQLRGFL